MFIREGCATGWPHCPNGDRAITVQFVGDRLTSCIAIPEPADVVYDEPLGYMEQRLDEENFARDWTEEATQRDGDSL